MKQLLSALLLTALVSGCIARKVITIPAKAVAKTAIKGTGKTTVGAVKLAIPNGEESETQ